MRSYFVANIAGLIVLAVGLSFTVLYNGYEDESYREYERLKASAAAKDFRRNVEQILQRHVQILSGLQGLVSAKPGLSDAEFRRFCIQQNPNLYSGSLELAPNGVVTSVYSAEKGLENIRRNLRDYPDQWADLNTSIRSRRLSMWGPFRFQEGSPVFLALRKPVLLRNPSNDAEEQLWGYVAILIHWTALAGEFDRMDIAKKFRYALKDIRTSSVIYGDPSMFDANTEDDILSLGQPDQYWRVAAIPSAGWSKTRPEGKNFFWSGISISMVLSLLTASLQFQTAERHRHLRALVDGERRMQLVLETTSEGCCVFDPETSQLSTMNRALCRILGKPEEELRPMIEEFFLRESKNRGMTQLLPYRDENNAVHREYSLFLTRDDDGMFAIRNQDTASNKSFGGDVSPRESKEEPPPLPTPNDLILRVSESILLDNRGKPASIFAFVSDITPQKRLEIELRHLAITDPLTGIFNRRHFMELGQRELERSQRYCHPLSALMLDIDHFKKINDTYGHQVGDVALITLTRLLLENLRSLDFVGRLGGEEFAIVLPETELAAAAEVAERLRSQIKLIAVPTDQGILRFTVSIGATAVAQDDTRVDDLISRADQALYGAKESGRDRVVVTSPQKPVPARPDRV